MSRKSFARDDRHFVYSSKRASVRACDHDIAGKIESDTLVNIGRKTTGSTSDVTGVSSPIVILVTACVIARDARSYAISANREGFAADCLRASGSTVHRHTRRPAVAQWHQAGSRKRG